MSIWMSDELFKAAFHLYPVSTKTVAGVKWGYMTSKGRLHLQPIYDTAGDFQANGLAVVQIGNKSGVINQYGTFIVKPKYESISEFSEGRAQVIEGNGFKVINETGKVLTSKSYSFIGSYKNERALFSAITTEGQYLYGYLDRHGNEIIPPKYMSGYDFQHDRTIVQVAPSQYALINRSGKILFQYKYPWVGAIGDRLMAFQEKENGKFGYIDLNGNIVIEPKFTTALPFENGFAVVNIAEDYLNQYGLINKEGQYIFPPVYNDIHLVGKNRVAVGKAIKEDAPYYGSHYALATTDGTILTDFIYLIILEFTSGVASVTTGQETFFIMKNGKINQGLPIVKGYGTLSVEGELIKANVDERTAYYTHSGKLIWRQNRIIPLQAPYKIIEKKYKPNKDYLVYYPQIDGMINKEAQQQVNDALKTMAQVKPVPSEVQLDSSYTGDFSIEFYKKDLIVVEIEGYEYPFGAAHGMPYRVYGHINLKNGNFYKLEDLFKEESNYVAVLSDLIAKQIENDEQYSYVFPDAYKGIKADQPFYVDNKYLYIFFEPYEIGPYAAGFPTFKIAFKEIMSMIDTTGSFWRAFHNKIRQES